MIPKRPPVILVTAIINLIFGGYWLLCALCSGVSTALSSSITSMFAGAGNAAQVNLTMGLDKVPGYFADQYVNAGVGLVMSTLLIFSGVGLLQMRRWGRTVGLTAAVLTIVSKLAILLFEVLYLNAAMSAVVREAIREELEKTKSAATQNPFFELMGSTAYYNSISALGALFFTIWPVVLLILLSRRSLIAALAGQPAEPVEQVDYRDPEPGSTAGPT
jgi:hypothetical protein